MLLVVIRQWLPLPVEMLDDPVIAGGGMLVDDPFDNMQGAVEPARVLGDIGQGEERLGGVHVAVGAAIGLLAAPVAVEGLAHRALLLAPEVRFDDPDRLRQQGFGAGARGHHRGTRRQGDEGMQVGGLAAVTVGMPGGGEPAAVFAVAQRAVEGGNAVVHQRGVTGNALDMGHGETVGHPCGVHGAGPGTARQAPALVQVAEAFGQPGRAGEPQQALAFGGQPVMMGRSVQPAAERQGNRVHGGPVVVLIRDLSLNNGFARAGNEGHRKCHQTVTITLIL